MASTENEKDELENISPHVHLTISKTKKKRWLEYAEEHYRGNLSSLIEEAVDNTLSGMWVLKDEDEADEAEVDISSLDEDISDINEQLAAMREQLDAVAGSTGPGTGKRLDRDELIKLANKVHDSLPLVSDTRELADLKKSVVTLPEDERAKLSGTVDDLAAHLERDQVEVWQACLFLEQDEHNNVHSLIDEGERRWYELKPGRADK